MVLSVMAARTAAGSANPSRSTLTFVKVNPDRKSTRLNSSHTVISYAVFCLKKKNEFDTEGDDAAREQIHHHHDPVAGQQDRFAREESYAPKTILGLAHKGQPRRTGGS